MVLKGLFVVLFLSGLETIDPIFVPHLGQNFAPLTNSFPQLEQKVKTKSSILRYYYSNIKNIHVFPLRLNFYPSIANNELIGINRLINRVQLFL
jgi:hypothetical protein